MSDLNYSDSDNDADSGSSSDSSINWTKYITPSLIKSLQLFIGGVEMRNLNGDGSSNTTHIGGTEEECYLCQIYDKKDGESFQYMTGNIHMKKEFGWFGYTGNKFINWIANDYFEIIKQLGN